jgi:hypothetical protein
MYVIGVAGKARHGKDFIGKIIQEEAECWGVNLGIFPFADPLKATILGENPFVTFEDVYVHKPDHVRHLLQQRGTEQGRSIHGEDIWTTQVYAYLRRFEDNFPSLDGVIIPDVRFLNEVEFVEHGGVPLPIIERRAREQVSQHFSKAGNIYTLDDDYYSEVGRVIEEWRSKASHGACTYIVSDRPTLEGSTATHPSETALDDMNMNRVSWVFHNNKDTTEVDIRVQVGHFLSGFFQRST